MLKMKAFLFIQLYCQALFQIIKAPLRLTKDGDFQIVINVGIKEKALFLNINMDNQYMFMTFWRKFTEKDDKIMNFNNKPSIISESNTINSFIGRVNFDKTELVLNSFDFYYVDSVQVYGNFPFSFKYLNATDPMKILVETNQIKRKAFAIDVKSKGFYFGGLPDEIKSDYKYEATIIIDKERITWGALLNKMSFNGKYFEVNNYFYFKPDIAQIFCPIEFFEFIKTKYFNVLIHEKVCSIQKREKNISQISCGCRAVKDLKIQISFFIQEYEITLDTSKLFINYGKYRFGDDECLFAIYPHFTDNANWVLGNHFLRIFPSLFDYENNSVTLLSSDFPFNRKSFHCKKIKNLFVFCIFLTLSQIIILITKTYNFTS